MKCSFEKFLHPMIRACIVIVVLFSAAGGQAQVLPFHTYTIHDGLISNAVNAMYQDTRGYIWIGTTDGLSIYDGTTFKNYTTSDGLAFSHINDITESKRSPGTMWIATNGGGLTRVREGTFKIYRTGNSNWTNRVNTVTEDHNGIIWCGADNGVFRVTGDSSVPFHLEKNFASVSSIIETRDGTIWITTPYHLYYTDSQAENLGEIDLGLHPGAIINRAALSRSGNLWVCRTDSIILQFDGKKIVRSMNVSHTTASLVEDNSGNLWVGSAHGLLKIVNYNSPAFRVIHYAIENGLRDNAVVVSLIDNENDLWINCFNNGMSKLSDFTVTGFPHSIDFSSGNNAMVTIDRNNHFWTVNGEYLCEFWDDVNGEWHDFHHHVGHKPYSVCCDTAGRLFIRELPGGFEEFEIRPVPNTHSVLLLKVSLYRGKDFPDFAPFCFLVDRNGRLWCSGDSIVTSIDLNKPHHPVTVYKEAQGMPDQSIRTFYEDRTGTIWCGGYLNGAIKIDPRTNAITTYTTADGLPDNSVRTFWEDSSGTMWIGTRYGGVVAMKQQGPVYYGPKNGLLSGAVSSLSGDAKGNVWVGTLSGLQYISSSGKKIMTNTELTGIRVHSFAVRNDGKILIITTDGFVLYDHPEEQPNRTPPPIYISQFRINDRTISPSSRMTFSHDENNCAIEFAGISLRNEQGMRYQYKLRENDDWQSPTTERTIVYRELPPGAYTFTVRAINSDGIVSATPAVAEFTILSAYWLRWWFILLCIMILASLVMFGIRLRLRRVVEIERLRSRIAADLHDDIGSGLIRIALLSEVIQRQFTAQGTPRTEEHYDDEYYSISMSTERVGEIARELVDAMSDVVWSIDPKNDTLRQLIRRVESFAVESCEAKGIRLALNIQPEIGDVKLTSLTLRCILLITKEALTNIIRHSKATLATITIEVPAGQTSVNVRVTDDGRGFDLNTLSRINGIENMQTRAEKAGGTLSIISSNGKGTTIALTIPIIQ